MIIGLSGYAGAGKDSVADILTDRFGFKRIAIADKLKEFLLRQNPTVQLTTGEVVQLTNYVSESSWNEAKLDDGIRAALQNTGSALRLTIDDAVWVNAFRVSLLQSGYVPGNNVVVPDIRYPNELNAVDQVWRVDRPGVGPVNEHESEQYVEYIPARQVINNDGTLEDLENTVDRLFRSL